MPWSLPVAASRNRALEYISNKFMQHFTGLRRGQIDEARKGLESDDCRLFKSERADNGYGRTYWLLDAEGKPYDGATVWDEYRRAAQTTSSRKASSGGIKQHPRARR